MRQNNTVIVTERNISYEFAYIFILVLKMQFSLQKHIKKCNIHRILENFIEDFIYGGKYLEAI